MSGAAGSMPLRDGEQAPASLNATNPRYQWRWFALVAGLSALAVIVFVAWTYFDFGGRTATAGADELGVAAAALLAAGATGWSALRLEGKRRLTGLLLSVTGVAWAAGEATRFALETTRKTQVTFPSVADAWYLIGLGAAAAAIIVAPAIRSRITTRGRMWLDGGTIAFSLLFVANALGLANAYQANIHANALNQLVWIINPLLDIAIATLAAQAIRRTAAGRRGRLVLWATGIAVVAMSNMADLFVTGGAHKGIGDTGYVVGFVLISLSRAWPGPTEVESDVDAPVALWQMAVPGMALVVVLVTAVLSGFWGPGLTRVVLVPAVGLVVLMMTSQLLTYRESLALLTGSKRAESQLRERTELLHQIFVHAPLGIARVRRDMTIIDANPAFSALMRSPLDAIIGTSIIDHIPPGDLAFVADKMQQLEAGTISAVETDTQATRSDGSQLWVHWRATAVRDQQGVDYYLGTFEDFTAKHESEQLALASLAGLERLSRLKSEFISMVSHEFRTGLVGIQGFSEVMTDEELQPTEVREFAQDINKDAQRLNRMISEMLDLDRMESGRMSLQLSPQDINAKIRETVERAAVTSAKHSIVFDLDPNLPTVRADSDRIIQVLTNLLSNAIKYSPAGGEIRVSTRLEDGFIHVRVRDHGLGIPPEYMDRLFVRYERFESTQNKIVGTGLGLAITRQIIEMHGGKIWAESKLGDGSEFHFTLPTSVRAANPSWTMLSTAGS